MEPDSLKVIEIICSKLPSKAPTDEGHYDDFHQIIITEEEFAAQGLTVARGVSLLKHDIAGKEPIIYISNVFETEEDLYPPDYEGKACVSCEVHPAICSVLSSDNIRKQKPHFRFEDPVLIVNDIKIPFGENEYGRDVLRYIFSHDRKEQSFYREIHEEYFPNEKFNAKRFYDASKVVKNRVAEKTGIPDFLIFNSSDRGQVQINPKYLP